MARFHTARATQRGSAGLVFIGGFKNRAELKHRKAKTSGHVLRFLSQLEISNRKQSLGMGGLMRFSHGAGMCVLLIGI